MTEEEMRLVETVEQLLDRLAFQGSIDPMREEGPIEDLREALYRFKKTRPPKRTWEVMFEFVGENDERGTMLTCYDTRAELEAFMHGFNTGIETENFTTVMNSLETADDGACLDCAYNNGHTYEEAEECENGSVGCPGCPLAEKFSVSESEE